MNFYKNPAGSHNSLVLHRNEWNILKKRAGPPEKPSQLENEYTKALIEKSQGWIKTWPDTVQGRAALKEKQREKKQAEEIAAVKRFLNKKVRKDTADTIQKAKQQIFNDSCYGRKLISALLVSKTLEERDAQIKFKKEIKEKEAELELKNKKTMTLCTFDLDQNAAAVKDQKKCLSVQTAKENKEMYEKQKKEEAKAKEQQKLADLTDTQLMKYLLDREQEAEENIKLLEKQSLEQFAAEQKKTKEERAKWEAEYYAKIDKCQNEQQVLNCKIKKVHERIIKRTQDSEQSKINYEIVKKCQDEEKKRYQDFDEKNRKKDDNTAEKRERNAKEKEIQDRNNKISIAEVNKKMGEYVKLRECNNKCFCDRQSLITKSDKERNKKKGKDENESESKELRKLFIAPCNKLLSALKRREKEPSPWTGVNTAHQLFAKNADQTVQECKYKKAARKVVDEYRKYNALDIDAFPIPNYN